MLSKFYRVGDVGGLSCVCCTCVTCIKWLQNVIFPNMIKISILLSQGEMITLRHIDRKFGPPFMCPVQTVWRDISSSVLLQASSETLCSEFKIIFLSLAKWFWTSVWKMPRSTAHWFKDKTNISLKETHISFHSSNNVKCCTGKKTDSLYIVSRLLRAPLGYLLFLHPFSPRCKKKWLWLWWQVVTLRQISRVLRVSRQL